MPNSYQTHTSNGVSNSFSFASIDGYLQLSHIKVYVDGVLRGASGYTIDAAAKTVTFTPNPPANGSVVRIARETPNTVAGRVVDYTDGSVLTASDLDAANLQTIFLAQEAADKGGEAFQRTANEQAWDAQNIRISSVAAPVADSDAATKLYIDNLALAGGAGGAPVADPQSWAFTGTGSTLTFTLANPTPNATSANLFIVEVGGVLQHPVTNYTITSGGVLTFPAGQAPPNNATIRVRNFGIARSVTASVTEQLIAPNAITASKIANSAVTNDKIMPGIDTRKLAGSNSFTPRFTLTWYPNSTDGGVAAQWRKMELPLAAGVTNPYHPNIQFGRYITFGNSTWNMVSIVWGRIALKAPSMNNGVPVVDVTKIPAFPWGQPAQLRIDGLPPLQNDGWGTPCTIPSQQYWPSAATGADARPDVSPMGTGQWLNGIYRNFQGATTPGFPAPPLKPEEYHWCGGPTGGYVTFDPQAAMTNQHVGVESNIVLEAPFPTAMMNLWRAGGTTADADAVSNVFAGTGNLPYNGVGGRLIPSGTLYTSWIAATATQVPTQGSAPFVLHTFFFGIVPGGFAV